MRTRKAWGQALVSLESHGGSNRPQQILKMWAIIFVTAAILALICPAIWADGSDEAATSLVGLWHFDRLAASKVHDSSGHGNNGTVTGAALAPGKFSNALSFNGTSDFVSVPDSASLDIPGSVTVEAWVKLNQIRNPGIETVLAKENSSFPIDANYNLHIINDKLFFSFTFNAAATFASGSGGCDPGGCFVTGATLLDTQGFHHVAGVYDDSTKTMSVYLDGVLDGAAIFTTTGSPTTNAQSILIGERNFSNAGTQFPGLIDEVRVWNRALGANEILASAQAGLRGLWHFNEGSGTTVADSSGYGNTGTVNDASFVPGQTNFGTALTFDGTNDFVQLTHSSTLDFINAYTLEAWVSFNGAQVATSYLPIFFRATKNSDEIEVYVQKTSGDLVVAHNRLSGDTQFDCNLFPEPPANQVFHLAVVYTGKAWQAYYNGVSQTALAGQGCVGPMHKLQANGVGWFMGKVDHAEFGGANFLNGTIDEAHFWARPLSADEVKFLAGVSSTAACSSSAGCSAELILPEELGQEFGDDDNPGAGAVYGSEYEYKGPASPRRAMGLEFIASDAGPTVINPSGAPEPCAEDDGSRPGHHEIGGLLGCQADSTGKSALVTGKQIPVRHHRASNQLGFDLNVTGDFDLDGRFEWK